MELFVDKKIINVIILSKKLFCLFSEHGNFICIDISKNNEDSEVEVIKICDINSDHYKRKRTTQINDINSCLLFQTISDVLTEYINSKVYESRFGGKTSLDPFSKEEKELFFMFLHNNRFLCEIANPTLYKILAHYKFLGREEITCFKHFMHDAFFKQSNKIFFCNVLLIYLSKLVH